MKKFKVRILGLTTEHGWSRPYFEEIGAIADSMDSFMAECDSFLPERIMGIFDHMNAGEKKVQPFFWVFHNECGEATQKDFDDMTKQAEARKSQEVFMEMFKGAHARK